MSGREDGEATLAGQIIVAIALFLVANALYWFGINDRIAPPHIGDDNSPEPSRSSVPTSTAGALPRSDGVVSSSPPSSPEPSLASDPSLQLTVDPMVIDEYDAQSDLAFTATLTSDLPSGSKVLFSLSSAPGMTGFDYSIDGRVESDGTASADFELSPCSLLDLDHQVAAAAEGDYIIEVQDMRTGLRATSSVSMWLADGADDFSTWRGGNCTIY